MFVINVNPWTKFQTNTHQTEYLSAIYACVHRFTLYGTCIIFATLNLSTTKELAVKLI